MALDRGAQPAPDAVPRHRGTNPAADGKRDARRITGVTVQKTQRDGAGSLPTGPREGLERRTVADAPDQAESRLRPRARRARSTARPPLVRMRSRNPWVLARLRLFGWYVRFNEEPPRGGPRAARGRGPRGRRKPPSVRLPSGSVQRGADGGGNARGPLSLKDTGATLRASPGGGRPGALPRGGSASGRQPAPLLQRSPQLWMLLWTTFRCRRTRRSGEEAGRSRVAERNGDR